MPHQSPPLINPSEWTSFELLQRVVDTVPDPIFVKDRAHRWIVFNRAFCGLLGQPREAILGKSDPDLFPREQVEIFWRGDDEVFDSGEPNENEEQLTTAAGEVRTIWTRKFPLRERPGGPVMGLCGIITDVTSLKDRLAKVERLESENEAQKTLIQAQNEMLEQLAVPVVEVWDGVLLLPLVGAINGRRAEQVMQSLLDAIDRHRAQIVIVDITGVPTVDTLTADYLMRAMKAAELLGARTMLVGVGPDIARMLVHLGTSLGSIETRSTLQAGLRHAMALLAGDKKR